MVSLEEFPRTTVMFQDTAWKQAAAASECEFETARKWKVNAIQVEGPSLPVVQLFVKDGLKTSVVKHDGPEVGRSSEGTDGVVRGLRGFGGFGKGSGGGGGYAPMPFPGEWVCGVCNATRCWATRSSCYTCGYNKGSVASDEEARHWHVQERIEQVEQQLTGLRD